jgi:hypothetical protein
VAVYYNEWEAYPAQWLRNLIKAGELESFLGSQVIHTSQTVNLPSGTIGKAEYSYRGNTTGRPATEEEKKYTTVHPATEEEKKWQNTDFREAEGE